MSSIHPERPVLQPVILQGARKINRRARGHGTSLITLPRRHGAPNTAIITEAILERKAAQHYLAQHDVVSVRAQVGPVPYRGLDNTQHTHVFDLLVERGDGRRIAVAVKPYALAVKERLDLKLGCIAQCIFQASQSQLAAVASSQRAGKRAAPNLAVAVQRMAGGSPKRTHTTPRAAR